MSGKWVTFDCYGTLIDWRTGMTSALDGVAPGHADVLIEAYHRLEPGLEAATPFTEYTAVLSNGLSLAAGYSGVELPPGSESILAETLPTWPPFADTRGVLLELRERGWNLAILTNCDRSLIDATVRDQLAVPIDDVITAQEVRSYKPGGGMFDEFISRQAPETWIHASTSVFHDVRPTKRRGAKTVLVDRDGTQDPAEPDRYLTELAPLPDTLQELS